MTRDYTYEDLSGVVEKDIGLILAQITHHIHPRIVSYITEKNIGYEADFRKICHERCNPAPFFYQGSDCIFPGFRRPINKEKSEKWKNNVFQEDGTILNDNTFPRHVWAYLSMNKAYSGGASGMWSKSGLDKFELAHIFAHKQDERAFENQIFDKIDHSIEPYGLFTSASNVVLIPKGFAKPTDHMKSIKVCFYKRHLDLYGNNIIGLGHLNEKQLPSWYNEIKWLEPALPDNWKTKIDNLLSYRNKYLARKYA